jgi:hypothetical protein
MPFVKKPSDNKKSIAEQNKKDSEGENKFGKGHLKNLYLEIANNGINKTLYKK